MRSGPLVGVRVVEFAGIGPAPFCGMLLADQGADVVRIDRPGTVYRPGADVTGRGKRSIAIDLKHSLGVEAALQLLASADALIEGFRPGVMERLGLGPDVVHERNPRLVYGRMTGWGQEGPWSQMAGHDINYIALTGALQAMGRRDEPPAPPLNLVGDYGGGALYLAFGVCAALLESRTSGKGQVIDCAMVDGAASLMTMFFGMRAMGIWTETRENNLLDGGAHFYRAYECADGKFLAVGALEPEFYAQLIAGLGFTDAELPNRMDRANWPAHAAAFAERFKSRTQAQWMAVFEGTDACVAPVLTMAEAQLHSHVAARDVLLDVDGVMQPSPAPRFSRTAGRVHGSAPVPGEHAKLVMGDWGIGSARADEWIASGAVALPPRG